MTDSSGEPKKQGTDVSLTQRLNKFRNLALQGAAEMSAPSADSVPPSSYYIEFNDNEQLLRKLGDTEAMRFLPETLADLAEREKTRILDLVFVEDSCIDLSFGLPDALLPELRQIAENEIQYRSPFNDGASYSFWVNEEQPDGHWRTRAAVTLKPPVDKVLAVLEDQGFKPGMIRRIAPQGAFSARPLWAGHSPSAKPRGIMASLPRSLKLSLLGAFIFCGSAIAATVQGGLTYARVSSEAIQARGTIAAQAQAAAGLRNLDRALAQSTDRLALTGTFSELLPEGVWLDQLIVDEDSVTLVGFAPSAAEITRLLATLPQLTDIRFASPVTRDNTQSLERFRIAATLARATP